MVHDGQWLGARNSHRHSGNQKKRLSVRGLRTRVPRLGLLHISGLTHFAAPPRGAHSPTSIKWTTGKNRFPVSNIFPTQNCIRRNCFRQTVTGIYPQIPGDFRCCSNLRRIQVGQSCQVRRSNLQHTGPERLIIGIPGGNRKCLYQSLTGLIGVDNPIHP